MLTISSTCALCGKGGDEVRKLMTGAVKNICDGCLDACNKLAQNDGHTKSGSAVAPCSLCSEKPGTVYQPENAGASISICAECMKLCNHIMADPLAPKNSVALAQKNRKREKG